MSPPTWNRDLNMMEIGKVYQSSQLFCADWLHSWQRDAAYHWLQQYNNIYNNWNVFSTLMWFSCHLMTISTHSWTKEYIHWISYQNPAHSGFSNRWKPWKLVDFSSDNLYQKTGLNNWLENVLWECVERAPMSKEIYPCCRVSQALLTLIMMAWGK